MSERTPTSDLLIPSDLNFQRYFNAIHFLFPPNYPGNVLKTTRAAHEEEAHVFTRAVAGGSMFPVDKLLPDSFGVYELQCLSEKSM